MHIEGIPTSLRLAAHAMVRLARIDPAKENAVPSAGGVHAVE
jgi:hypothetical protein